MEAAFRALLDGAGLTPRMKVMSTGDVPARRCRMYARRLGRAELLVLFRSWRGMQNTAEPEIDAGVPGTAEPEIDAVVQFRSVAHTYDIENGVYLGAGDRLPLRFGAYSFRAFARLPYRVDSVDLQVEDAPGLGETIVVRARLKVGGALAGPIGKSLNHRLRLDVLDESGRPLRYLAQEQWIPGLAGRFDVPTALNDPDGVWTLVVTEVMTGVTGRVAVDVGPRPAGPVPMPEPFQVDGIDD
jgi:hypothetical protein